MNDVQQTPQLITDPICCADYIKSADFLRPMVGGLVYGFVFYLPLSFAFGGIFCCSMALGMGCLILFAALVQWTIWQSRLKKEGPAAFQRFLELDMPYETAFELSLAATANLKRAKIENFNEASGHIGLRVKGNFWVTVDRAVDIIVQRVDSSHSRLNIGSVAKVTKFRDQLFRLIWGMKWYPIIVTNDINLNRKLLNQIVAAIENVPNWDYKHVSSLDLASLPLALPIPPAETPLETESADSAAA